MADSRMARELENRDAEKRPQAWAPPETLPSPNPVPGWTFRWIRTSIMGQVDPTNVSAQFRQGWEPVLASEHPELQMISTDRSGRFKDNIEIGGLVLCKIAEETIKQRAAYYSRQAKSQVEAVDNNFMKQKDSRTNMELFTERESATSFGKGNK